MSKQKDASTCDDRQVKNKPKPLTNNKEVTNNKEGGNTKNVKRKYETLES